MTVDVLPTGGVRVKQWLEPVRIRDGESWVDVDLTLRLSNDGTLRPAASPVDVSFSNGGNAPLAVIHTPVGSPVSVSWKAGALPVPTLDGPSATYADVFPGVDLRVTATVGGMSEVLVVRDETAATNPELEAVRFGIAGAVLSAHTGGTLVATAPDGSRVMAPAPTAWDSQSGGDESGPGGFGSGVPVAADVEPNEVSIDAAAAANAPHIQFPAFVDPDFSVTQANRTFTDNAYPNVAYWNGVGASDSYQHVGYINAGNSDDGLSHVTRSYWQMPTSKYAGREIESADFNTSLMWSSSCQARRVKLFTSTAVNSGTTWNNQPTSLTYRSEANTAAGYSSSCVAKTVVFDATSAVQAAADANAASLYLMLAAADETDWLAWKKFGANVALAVTYHTRPVFTGTFDAGCTRVPGMIGRDRLNAGDVRYSVSGKYALVMQGDGNLVFRQTATNFQLTGATALWASATFAPGSWADYQADGNLVVRRPSDGAALFNIGAVGPGYLTIQEDGNLVAYNSDGKPLWHTHTGDSGYGGIAVWCYSNKEANHAFRAVARTNGITDSGGNTPTELISYTLELHYNGKVLVRQMGNPAVASGVAAVTVFEDFGIREDEDTTFDWRVKACANGTTACTTTDWKRTLKEKRAGVEAPTVTVSSELKSDDSETNATIGKTSGTVTIQPPTTHDPTKTKPYGYLYGVFAGIQASGQTTAPPIDVAISTDVVSTNTGCGNPVGTVGYFMVCAASASAAAPSVTLRVTPVSTISRIVIYPFDVFGNLENSGASSVDLFAAEDADSYGLTEVWRTDQSGGGGTCPQGAVANSRSGVPNVFSPSLTLNGNACRLAASGTLPTTTPPFPTPTLNFAGNGFATTSPAPAVTISADTTFSVGAWVKPDTAGSGVGMTAISARGTNRALFYLQNVNGKYRFCMPTQDTSPYRLSCATSSANVDPGQWSFLVGIYDATNGQLRLHVSPNGDYTTPTIALYDSAYPSSRDLPIDIGANISDGTMGGNWDGQITRPFFVPGALSATQIKKLGSFHQNPTPA